MIVYSLHKEVWLELWHLRKEMWGPRQLLWGGIAIWTPPFVPMKLSGGETWSHQVPSRKVRLGCEVPITWFNCSVIK